MLPFDFQMSLRLMFSLKNENEQAETIKRADTVKTNTTLHFYRNESVWRNSAWNLILQQQSFCLLSFLFCPPPMNITSPLQAGVTGEGRRSRHTKKLLNIHRHGKYFICLLLVKDSLQEKIYPDILNGKCLSKSIKCSHVFMKFVI